MPSFNSLALAAVIAAAAVAAALRSPTPVIAHAAATPPAEAERFDPSERFKPSADGVSDETLPPGHPPVVPTDHAVSAESLPPGHPPLDATQRSTGLPHQPQGDDEEASPALVWKAPAKWVKVPNPNTMRLATYHVPPAKGATDDAELSVVQAGGSTAAHFDRWAKQFALVESDSRAQITVRRLAIATIELSGTFLASDMSASSAPTPRRAWTLRGAVVETPQSAYFFKLTGPTASVRAAMRDFDALLASLEPVEPVPL